MITLRRPAGWLVLGLALVAASSAACAQKRGTFKRLDVPYAGTPHAGVAAMLRLAEVGPNDIVYDLGSGDGRIVIAAVRDFGAKFAVGVDIDERRVLEGLANARKAGVSDRTRFVRDDVFKVDFSEATVLAMFMSYRIQTELLPRIRKLLKPGTRIVTYRFPIVGWQPHRIARSEGNDVYLWIVPDRWPAER
jgi:ribosomal protein L11 methylase PrmA